MNWDYYKGALRMIFGKVELEKINCKQQNLRPIGFQGSRGRRLIYKGFGEMGGHP